MASITLQVCFTTRERTLGTHCIGGWVGLRVSLDVQVREKNPLPLSGIEPITQSAVRHYNELPHSLTSVKLSVIKY
jgi:hypothetical protein